MKYLTAAIFFLVSFMGIAQEETVEVGKYAHANVDAVSMIMSLLMVLALILASAWLLRKFNFANKSISGMKVVASLSLGHKEKLVVVEVGKEQLLLGVSSGQINLIKTLEQPLDISMPTDINQSLLQLFNKSKQKQEG